MARHLLKSWHLLSLFVLVAVGAASPAQNAGGKKYPFANSPLEIYDHLVKAELGKVPPLQDDDRKLLAEMWASRSAKPAKPIPQSDETAVTAHLLASGVDDPKARAEYLKQFNKLVDAAKEAIAAAKTDGEKADLLLRFLHKRTMANHYDAEHTSLAEVFDTGKFNCVSSSAIYFLTGDRLGLKLQPILIPGLPYCAGHAAVDLVDGGKRVVVEPTNPNGYDWTTKLKQPGVIVIGPQPDRKKGYDCDGYGLAASAANNLGVAAGKSEPTQRITAIRYDLIALAFAPNDGTAHNNLIADVLNWGLKLSEAKRYDEALHVHAFGRKALGPIKDLEQNYSVIWSRYLEDVFAKGQVKAGLELLPKASATFPKDKLLRDPAEWVERAARKQLDKDKANWNVALAFADTAAKDLAPADAKRVIAWKDQARRMWSQSLLSKGDVAGSMKVLADGYAETPESKELAEGIAYHTRTALESLAKKSPAAAITHYTDLCTQFPKIKDIHEAGNYHAYQAVNKLAKEKKYSEALATADTYQLLAGDKLEDFKCNVYDQWARSFSDKGKWEDGLAKYVEGLGVYPKNELLGNNVIALIDRWAGPAIKQKNWAEAVRIFEIGLKQFPMDKHLKERRDECTKRIGK